MRASVHGQFVHYALVRSLRRFEATEQLDELDARADAELSHRVRDVARDGGVGEPELVRDELVRLAERGEVDDGALARSQRPRIGQGVLVRTGHDEAAAVALEAVDERPAASHERAPRLRRAPRIRLALTASGVLLPEDGFA